MGEVMYIDFVFELFGDYNQCVLDFVVVYGVKQSFFCFMFVVIFRIFMYYIIIVCELVGVYIVICVGYCWQFEYFDQ